MKLSRTEQDYVKTIYELGDRTDHALVSLKDVTAQLAVSAPSVTEMAKRIEKKGLIKYQSYKGVTLTPRGNKEALLVLKAHRVWECFLIDVLNYEEEDVHCEAEALEHAVSPQLIERLYAYLGKPAQCPHGRNIPQETFWYKNKQDIALTDLPHGTSAEFSYMCESFRTYVQKIGISEEPRFIKINETLADGTYIALLNNTQECVLPPFFQQEVYVTIYQ